MATEQGAVFIRGSCLISIYICFLFYQRLCLLLFDQRLYSLLFDQKLCFCCLVRGCVSVAWSEGVFTGLLFRYCLIGGCVYCVALFLSEAVFTVLLHQRPHSAGGVWVVPDVQGRRVQGGGAHDAWPAQCGMGAGCGAVHCESAALCRLELCSSAWCDHAVSVQNGTFLAALCRLVFIGVIWPHS